MKTLSAFALLLCLPMCGEARAQFTQPPPDRAAPACDMKKTKPAAGSVCDGDHPLAIVTQLQCVHRNDAVECIATSGRWVYDTWVPIDPSILIHDWAFIVDGQEYYLPPTHSHAVVVGCGDSGLGHIRVSAGGEAAIVSFDCARSADAPI